MWYITVEEAVKNCGKNERTVYASYEDAGEARFTNVPSAGSPPEWMHDLRENVNGSDQ